MLSIEGKEGGRMGRGAEGREGAKEKGRGEGYFENVNQ